METIHSETYALMIDTYIPENEKDIIFNGISKLEGVKKKADWAKKWLNNEISFAERLVAFTIVEGLFFRGSPLCYILAKICKRIND